MFLTFKSSFRLIPALTWKTQILHTLIASDQVEPRLSTTLTHSDVEYAHTQGIEVGGYDLICLQRGKDSYGGNVGDQWDVINSQGQVRCIFCRCCFIDDRLRRMPASHQVGHTFYHMYMCLNTHTVVYMHLCLHTL